MGEVEGEIEGVEDEEEQEGSNKQRGSFVHGFFFFFFFSLTPTPTLTLTFSHFLFDRVCVVGRRGKEGRRGACFFFSLTKTGQWGDNTWIWSSLFLLSERFSCIRFTSCVYRKALL